MCGLVGVAGTIGRDELDTFKDMLIFDQVRGKDSVGVAGVSRALNEIRVAKGLMDPVSFLEMPYVSGSVCSMGQKVLIGHNRAATIGKVVRTNAHPFEFDGIVGAHNGTIDWGDRRKLEDADKFGTDSEALFYTIRQKGIVETIESFSEERSAWALTWYDQDTNTINLLRNKLRPLVYAFSDDGQTLFWSSEAGILAAAAGRNNVKLEKMYVFPENKWWSWKIPEHGARFEKAVQVGVEAKIVERPFVGSTTHGQPPGKTVAARTVSTPTKSGGRLTIRTTVGVLKYRPGLMWDPEKREWYDPSLEEGKQRRPLLLTCPESDGKSSSDKSKRSNTGRSSSGVGTIPRDHRGTVLGKERFTNLTKDGCSWCGDPVTYGDNVRFLKQNFFLCENCNESDSLSEEDKELLSNIA